MRVNLEKELHQEFELKLKEQASSVKEEVLSQFKEKLASVKLQHKQKVEQVKAKLSEKHLRELTEVELRLREKLESEFEEALNEQRQAQVEAHVEDLERMQASIDHLEQALAEATQLAESNLQNKYEQRLEMVRKCHQEELAAVRLLNSTKEQELEQ